MTATPATESKLVLVWPGTAVAERPRLFAALAAAFAVRFAPWASQHSDAAGLITIGPDDALPLGDGTTHDRLPRLAVAAGATTSGPAEQFTVRGVPGVDRRLHGIELCDRFTAPPFDHVGAEQDVLAVSGSQPVWLGSSGANDVQRVRSALPELASGEVLYRLLGARQLTAIALVQFLRKVSSPGDWRPPRLRAAFLFDDPNLRWRRYGFIDYERLVRHADEHDYHAAMAMIPIDAGRPHPPQLGLAVPGVEGTPSLVVHGTTTPRTSSSPRAITQQPGRSPHRLCAGS